MKTIGLVMIVKNEAHVIVRCLESIRPLLDYALVVDTGSTDATREIVTDYCSRAGLAGIVIERPWVDFARNRSEALEALRQVAAVDYAVTIDADETLSIDADFDLAAFKTALSADLYDIEVHNGTTIYRRSMLFSNRLPFRYRGVLHEFLEAPPDIKRALGRGMHVVVSHDGARSQNANKYADDAAVLEAALADETDAFLASRYTFYLAQSYRDSGQLQAAHDAYLRRAEQGFWIEEVYVSLLRAAQLSEALALPAEQQIAAYLRAYEAVPARAEALHGAAAVCRVHQRYHLGYLLARQGIQLPLPDNGLFLDKSVYDYRMLDEFQINAYWAGHYQESLDAAATLLRDGRFPEQERPRLVANADYALRKLTPPPANLS